jgi:hypothetical protein
VNATETTPTVIETTTNQFHKDSIKDDENATNSLKINTKNMSTDMGSNEKNRKFVGKGSVDFELL